MSERDSNHVTTASREADDLESALDEAARGPLPAFRKNTDLGNAERMADRLDGRMLWVYGMGWLYWDGKRWVRDEANRILKEAGDTARSIYREESFFAEQAAQATDESERDKWAKFGESAGRWARQSEASSKIAAMAKLASAQPRLVLSGGPMALDADHYALNVGNGILDLKTYKLRDHDPASHHTRVTTADYDPNAQSDLWDNFIEQVIPSEDVRRWVQKWVGSSLYGDYSHELPILWGHTKNGKSTFLRAVRSALGDYAMEAAPELLIRKGGSRSAGDMSALADLRGRRFVTTIETGQGVRLDEVFVKQLTGEHILKSKFMRQDWFEFENQSSIALGTNHRPEVQGADKAIWERLFCVPFNVFIKPEDRDLELGDKLEAPEVAAAILAWAVEGLRLYDAEGLRPAPAEIQETTAAYQEEMDPLHPWLDAECELDPAGVVPIKWLRAAYEGWCEYAGVKPLSNNDFKESLEARGLTRPRGSKRVGSGVHKVWQGITLANTEPWMFEIAARHSKGSITPPPRDD